MLFSFLFGTQIVFSPSLPHYFSPLSQQGSEAFNCVFQWINGDSPGV